MNYRAWHRGLGNAVHRRGVGLLMALSLMLAASLLAMAALQTSLVALRQAASRQLHAQSHSLADTALRYGELAAACRAFDATGLIRPCDALTCPPAPLCPLAQRSATALQMRLPPASNTRCANGLCLAQAGVQPWLANSTWTDGDTTKLIVAAPGQAQYLLEALIDASGDVAVRVTARGQAHPEAMPVLLQSLIKPASAATADAHERLWWREVTE